MSDLSLALSTTGAGIITALGGMIIPLVPKVFTWLNAKIHGERVLLLRQTLDNQAVVYVEYMLTNQWGVDQAIEALADYVRMVSLPQTIKSLKLTDMQVEEMARAAFLRAYTTPLPRHPG